MTDDVFIDRILEGEFDSDSFIREAEYHDFHVIFDSLDYVMENNSDGELDHYGERLFDAIKLLAVSKIKKGTMNFPTGYAAFDKELEPYLKVGKAVKPLIPDGGCEIDSYLVGNADERKEILAALHSEIDIIPLNQNGTKPTARIVKILQKYKQDGLLTDKIPFKIAKNEFEGKIGNSHDGYDKVWKKEY